MKIATSVVRNSVYRFEGYGRRVTVCEEVSYVWRTHRQTKSGAVESFGVLMGTSSIDRRNIWVEAVTIPMSLDRRSRYSFALRDPGHQREVCQNFTSSGNRSIYLGTWHTHPEPVPEPSDTDRSDWRKCLRANHKRPLAFVVVGIHEVRVYVRARGKFRSLQQENMKFGIV